LNNIHIRNTFYCIFLQFANQSCITTLHGQRSNVLMDTTSKQSELRTCDFWIRKWSYIATYLAVVERPSSKKPKAPLFQIGLGWNLTASAQSLLHSTLCTCSSIRQQHASFSVYSSWYMLHLYFVQLVRIDNSTKLKGERCRHLFTAVYRETSSGLQCKMPYWPALAVGSATQIAAA